MHGDSDETKYEMEALAPSDAPSPPSPGPTSPPAPPMDRTAARSAPLPHSAPCEDRAPPASLDDTLADPSRTVVDTEPLRLKDDEPVAPVRVTARDAEAIFDKPESVPTDTPSQIDTEAGTMRVAVKFSIREFIRPGAFGVFLICAVLAAAATGLASIAVISKEWPYIAASGVAVPLTYFFTYSRYRRWLASKPYIFRLLQSLGEDMDSSSLPPVDQARQPPRPKP